MNLIKSAAILLSLTSATAWAQGDDNSFEVRRALSRMGYEVLEAYESNNGVAARTSAGIVNCKFVGVGMGGQYDCYLNRRFIVSVGILPSQM